MYLMKIYTKKHNQLIDVRTFEHFENAVAAVCNRYAFEKLTLEELSTLGNPELYCTSVDEEHMIADDFEFRYPNGIVVYIGQTCPQDREALNN